jgi:hypothetical protein
LSCSLGRTPLPNCPFAPLMSIFERVTHDGFVQNAKRLGT